jgi:hypothetical protein
MLLALTLVINEWNVALTWIIRTQRLLLINLVLLLSSVIIIVPSVLVVLILAKHLVVARLQFSHL